MPAYNVGYKSRHDLFDCDHMACGFMSYPVRLLIMRRPRMLAAAAVEQGLQEWLAPAGAAAQHVPVVEVRIIPAVCRYVSHGALPCPFIDACCMCRGDAVRDLLRSGLRRECGLVARRLVRVVVVLLDILHISGDRRERGAPNLRDILQQELWLL